MRQLLYLLWYFTILHFLGLLSALTISHSSNDEAKMPQIIKFQSSEKRQQKLSQLHLILALFPFDEGRLNDLMKEVLKNQKSTISGNDA